jgi:hypothetical protein
VQDAQILLHRPRRLLLQQRVVGEAELTAGEQVRPVAVVRERPRLTDQPVDHVPVFDPVLAPAAQPRQLIHPPLGVPHLDPLGVQPGLDALADQPAGHRVGVALDVDRAAAVHPHAQPLARLQPPRRQPAQERQLLGEPPLAVAVQLREQPSEERFVGWTTVEVAAAPQHQGLVQGALELPVALFGIAVLVRTGRLDRLPLQPVVPQQGLIALGERRPFRPRGHGGRQAIGAMQLGDPAQLPQGVLQALAEALEALGEADRPGLPVRVGEHEVVDQVVEWHAVQGHLQVAAVGEITGRQAAGVMDLGKEHLLGRPVQRPPTLDVPLQGTQLTIGEAAGKPPLQVSEEGLGLQAGVAAEQRFQLRPDLGERVDPRTPVTVHTLHLRGQPTQAAVAAGSLGVHAGLGRGQFLGQPLAVETPELTDLGIGNHREPPVVGLSMVYRAARIGNSNGRRRAELVRPDREF